MKKQLITIKAIIEGDDNYNNFKGRLLMSLLIRLIRLYSNKYNYELKKAECVIQNIDEEVNKGH